MIAERAEGSGAPAHVALLRSVRDEEIEETAETEGAVDPGFVSR